MKEAGAAQPDIRFHPLGWVSAAVLALAVLYGFVLDTTALIGNLRPWHWLALVGVTVLSLFPAVLHRIRLLIDGIASGCRQVAWVLAWVVFLAQLVNVTTRYTNSYLEADIYFAEFVSVAWQSFGLIFLLGVSYGVRDGVNPRIDFWWRNYSLRAKGALDFVVHSLLLVPFLFMGLRLVYPYAETALGRKKTTGEWPSGWRVWESWEQSGNVGELPLGPIKAMIVVGFALFTVAIIGEVIKAGFLLRGDEVRGRLAMADAPQRVE